MHAHFRQRGVTLIELLTVVMVVGILAAIAIPSYRQYTLKANRADAKVALTNTAQMLERCYTTATPQSYVGCPAPTAVSANGYYAITAAIDAGGQIYTLTATGQNGQQDDSGCSTMTLDQAGVRTPATGCW